MTISIIALNLLPGSRRLRIRIRSEGCSDRGKHGICGKSFVWVNGKDVVKRKKRGHNVVVIDYPSGEKNF